MTLHSHTLNGLPLQTGDILCTKNGDEGNLFAQFWRLMGLLVPGEIDHCAIYLGPGGRCVESGAKGVITFVMPGMRWHPEVRARKRGLYDVLVGVAYPLEGRGLSLEEQQRIRQGVAAYCLEKVVKRAPYNVNFFNPEADGAFYCSQLIYKAYLSQGIDLNTNHGIPSAPVLDKVVFPQEIWNACVHRRIP
jgi:hypothetical protein